MDVSLEQRVLTLESEIKLLQRCMDYAMDAKMEATVAGKVANKALEVVQDIRANLVMQMPQVPAAPTEEEIDDTPAEPVSQKYFKKVFKPESDQALSDKLEGSLTDAAWAQADGE